MMNIEEFVSLLKNNLDLKRRGDYIEYGDILDLLEEIKSSSQHETSKVITNEEAKEVLQCKVCGQYIDNGTYCSEACRVAVVVKLVDSAPSKGHL